LKNFSHRGLEGYFDPLRDYIFSEDPDNVLRPVGGRENPSSPLLQGRETEAVEEVD
jgi:hypothetical protein